MSQNTGVSSRANQLQFLRFLAFCLIFFWHGKAWLPVWPSQPNTAFSMVSFFFVLSGVTKGYSAYDKPQILTVKSYFSDIFKRLIKIYPLYAITTLCAVPYSAILRALSEKNPHLLGAELQQLLKHLLLIQSWYDQKFFSFNGLGWFLATLMFLFLFSNPTVYLLQKITNRRSGTLLLGGLLATILGATVAYNFFIRNLNMQFFAYIFPPARLGEYIGGILLGFLVRRLPTFFPKLKPLFTALEISALLLWCAAFFLPIDTWSARTVNWLLPNFFGLFVFAVGGGAISTLFARKPLENLGNMAFECFLLHEVIIKVYTRTAVIPAPNVWTNVFSLLFCFALTLILAHTIHRAADRRK